MSGSGQKSGDGKQATIVGTVLIDGNGGGRVIDAVTSQDFEIIPDQRIADECLEQVPPSGGGAFIYRLGDAHVSGVAVSGSSRLLLRVFKIDLLVDDDPLVILCHHPEIPG